MNEISVKVPGKLYIAGEYSVVTPGQSAIIMTVDRFLTVTIRPSHVNSFFSEGFMTRPLTWNLNNQNICIWSDHADSNPLVKQVIQTFEHYRHELQLTARHYEITIESTLNHIDGQKFGLGSSGALCVGLVKALGAFYKLALSPKKIYQLAVLAQLQLQMSSSFGDLAASAYTGMIRYSSPDQKTIRQWLNESITLREILARDWPLFSVTPIELPSQWTFSVGWTKSPASSHSFVSRVYKNATHMEKFWTGSEKCVEDLVLAYQQENWQLFCQAIATNRLLLNDLASHTQVQIETSALRQFCDLAEKHDGIGKSSGAGGGDCGIAWFNHHEKQTYFNKQLTESKRISLLNLTLYKEDFCD